MVENAMTRDSEIPAIFNPKRVRAPSVVVTGDSPNGPFGGFTNNVPQITHSDSVTSSQHDGQDSLIGITVTGGMHGGCDTPTSQPHALLGSGGGGLGAGPGGGGPGSANPAPSSPPSTSRLKACRASCCSELAQKMYFGVCVTVLVTASWVGATHCIKFLYLRRNTYASTLPPHLTAFITDGTTDTVPGGAAPDQNSTSAMIVHGFGPTSSFLPSTAKPIVTSDRVVPPVTSHVFNAPFFASWFCTNFAILFFPIYILGRVAIKKCDGTGEVLGEILRGFRDRGFTIGRFLNRCLTFCILWLLTTYLYALSLKALLATDVMALFATNVACVYLLAWVILQEQFVGVRIVAVILCDTGIALLAYMDGITGSPTLGGVVLAALAAAGYAVFKVMFRKVMGDPPVGQIAFTFSIIGFLNAAILWPVCIALYFTGAEIMPWETLPWVVLLMASVLLLVFHILTQFSSAVTYNMFVTLGLITAVPVSAALDIVLYGAHFAGMKLAGIILIAVGFFLVMFPDNWPDYITRLLRKTGRALLRNQCCCDTADNDYENSKYHLVGSQREMGSSSSKRNSIAASRRHRLSDGLHSIASSLSLWPGEMTDLQQQQQHLQHQQSLQHFQHILRNDSSSDFVGLNPHAKLRHYSLTEMTTNFIRKPGSIRLSPGLGTGSGPNSLSATSSHRYPSMNGRSSSYGSLE
ncbi:solute carrier family 35 member F4 isoform X1 [Anopheles stephensi]|nr:solute carrier family 35 member F4 isoform X1 [Anopheles stephensi]XP_035894459.1 solute carrier family 35 member F4 isoform X1 [Anopheles stephensi]XP_035894460.1 solute carrier family 35 member F4 isoform X1 [Anopheles stephensi]XP_035894461.1 solute carrier family 35 member F4 isoform X1 [Anopheles stephensi]XP_035894462.1 solute carrier family 35 member F4 isoform X1 [Anopheles stephensi]XP_035894463.1 solute carrier family 35 member F4 isoform X1 [Anopheles stephensi]XP_035894464.1 so